MAAVVAVAVVVAAAAVETTKVLIIRAVKSSQIQNIKPSIFEGFFFPVVVISFIVTATLAFAPVLGFAKGKLQGPDRLPVPENKLVILGDSLTEGYGVAKNDAFPALLEKKILEWQKAKKGASWKVINAGISGSTSASGMARLQWQLKAKPNVLIIALGANDGLRGQPVANLKKNLSAMIELAKKNDIKVALAGMMVPPNYGKKYGEEFRQVFHELARDHKIKLIPFLLEKVAGEKDLNLPDGIHPNEKGHAILADTVFASIQNLLQ